MSPSRLLMAQYFPITQYELVDRAQSTPSDYVFLKLERTDRMRKFPAYRRLSC